MNADTIDRKALGKRLAAARKKEGYTSDSLAQVCDISAIYIRQIETGKYQPSISTLVKFGNVLHRSLDYFVQDSMEWNELNTLTGIAEKCKHLNPERIKMVQRMIDAMYEPTEES
ncbi:MAG: helix-turn-helix transcriptional regulator [Massilibacteroides sp.]|nr:helix-turn-helix transcriptional regulator [Massilibacteroides sp.]